MSPNFTTQTTNVYIICVIVSLLQVWKFESDSTLADALSGNLGQWPEDIEEIMLGRVDETQPVEKREAAVSDMRGEAGLNFLHMKLMLPHLKASPALLSIPVSLAANSAFV
jgi:hypothetical protein